jgi:hypothetical protein
MLWTTATRLKVESNPHEKRKSVEAELSVIVFNGSKPKDLVFLLFLHLNLKHSSATRTSASICSYPERSSRYMHLVAKPTNQERFSWFTKRKEKRSTPFAAFRRGTALVWWAPPRPLLPAGDGTPRRISLDVAAEHHPEKRSTPAGALSRPLEENDTKPSKTKPRHATPKSKVTSHALTARGLCDNGLYK